MDNILITSAGQRVSLVKFFQNEIRKLNSQNKVFTVDLNPVLSPACQISDGFEKVEKVSDPAYIDHLLDFCKKNDIKLVVPTIDTELLVLAENQKKFLTNGIKVVISSADFINMCRDKRKTGDFFAGCGIDVPMVMNKNNLSFPLFIKPYDGSLSKDTFLVLKESELNEYHFENEKLIFMEYIDHDLHDEYTVDAYYDQNSVLKCLVPRKRIFVRAGEVNKGVTSKNEILTFVKKKLSKIAGAIGCITLQFFFNPQTRRIIGIEINPRFGGGYPLSYLAGANYPKFLIDEYILQKRISYFEDWEDHLLMLRYEDEVLVRNYEK